MRLAADENLDGRVLRGLRRRRPELDVVRAQDVGLEASDDREILAWAAEEERVLLSHDVRTMTAFAVARIHAGEPLAGLVIVPQSDAVGRIIDALIQLVDERLESGFQDEIIYLKL